MHQIIRVVSVLLVCAAASPTFAQSVFRYVLADLENPNVTDGDNTTSFGLWESSADLEDHPSPASTFAFAAQVSEVWPEWMTGIGTAQALTRIPDDRTARAESTLHLTLNLSTTTQLTYDYLLFVGPPASPMFIQREASINLAGLVVDLVDAGGSTGSGAIVLGPGTHSITASAIALSDTVSNPSPTIPVRWELAFNTWGGQNQNNPFQPTGTGPGGGWIFGDLPGRRWFDPVTANGFEFEMLSGGSFFTEAGMPDGLGDLDGYVLSYLDGTTPVLETVAAGGTHFFPAGVTSFKVLDIDPPFDPDDPMAFPIFLDFSTDTASFSMTPILVPEPTSLALLGLAGALLGMRRRRGEF